MKKGYIYAIKNLKTGKFYIGQTINLKDRKYRHFKRMRNGKHRGPKLLNSYNKHGEVFVFGVIESVSREKLNERETYWIKKFDSVENGYNCDYGGANPLNLDKCKAVRAFEPDGVTYTDYPSIIEASRQLGIDRSTIQSSLIKGVVRGGSIWFYLNKSCPETVPTFSLDIRNMGYRAFEESGIRYKDFNSLKHVADYLNVTVEAVKSSLFRGHCTGGVKVVPIYEDTPTSIEKFSARTPTPTKYKKVKSTNINTQEVKYYDTVKEASQKIKVHRSNINRACNGDAKTCKGCTWEYII